MRVKDVDEGGIGLESNSAHPSPSRTSGKEPSALHSQSSPAHNPYAVPSWCSGTMYATTGHSPQANREYDKPISILEEGEGGKRRGR